MLRFFLSGQGGRREFDLEGGPIEFGREPRPGVARCLLDDPYVGRDQLRVEERPGGRAALLNLSRKTSVRLHDGAELLPGEGREVALPARLEVGNSLIEIVGAAEDPCSFATLDRAGAGDVGSVSDLGEAPAPLALARWLEEVVGVQRAAAGSAEFYREAARAVVERVGLDSGLVLLRRGDSWEVAARHPGGRPDGPEFSRAALDRVLGDPERRTLFRVPSGQAAASLEGVTALVASPILGGAGDEILGFVYGSRRGGVAIRPLVAQLVQVLASAVAAGLARQRGEAEAARRLVQLEQFVSPEVAGELDRDPALMTGARRAVTLLAADLRGFTSIVGRIGPDACRLAGDLMDIMTERVIEGGGVVVDYAGDGLLAMWNAPLPQPDHAALACRAALAIRGDLPALDARWAGVVGGPLGLGIGIESGEVVVGNTGSRRMLKYGPLGHAVNLVSRIEGATKHLGAATLVGPTARAALGEAFATRRLARVRLVGVGDPLDLFELHGERGDPGWLSLRDAYEAALARYEAADFAGACRLLRPIMDAADGHYDPPTLSLLARAVEGLLAPGLAPEPVVTLGSK